MQWHPIKTAPRDGSLILLADVQLYNGPEVFAARWDGKDEKYPWTFLDRSKSGEAMLNKMRSLGGPTHWMPLPEPPELRADRIARTTGLA